MPLGELKEHIDQIPDVLNLLTGETRLKVQAPPEEAVI